MNMQNLMAQAQKMQKEIESSKKEIDQTLFISESEWVKVEMYGSKKIHKIEIKKTGTFDEDDKEILADMLMIAINGAYSQIDQKTKEKMGKYGSALNGLL